VAVLRVLLKSVSEPMHSFLKALDPFFHLLEALFVFGVTVRVLVHRERVLVIVCLSHDLNLLRGKANSGLPRASVDQSSQRMATLLEESCQRRST
jgi:hypothetical protein